MPINREGCGFATTVPVKLHHSSSALGPTLGRIPDGAIGLGYVISMTSTIPQTVSNVFPTA